MSKDTSRGRPPTRSTERLSPTEGIAEAVVLLVVAGWAPLLLAFPLLAGGFLIGVPILSLVDVPGGWAIVGDLVALAFGFCFLAAAVFVAPGMLRAVAARSSLAAGFRGVNEAFSEIFSGD